MPKKCTLQVSFNNSNELHYLICICKLAFEVRKGAHFIALQGSLDFQLWTSLHFTPELHFFSTSIRSCSKFARGSTRPLGHKSYLAREGAAGPSGRGLHGREILACLGREHWWASESYRLGKHLLCIRLYYQ